MAELNPTKAYKFLSVNYKPSNQSSLNAKPVTLGNSNFKFSIFTSQFYSLPISSHFNNSADDPMIVQDTNLARKAEPGATVLLVISLVVVFAILTIGMALLISRRRKRGKIINPDFEYSKLMSIVNGCDD